MHSKIPFKKGEKGPMYQSTNINMYTPAWKKEKVGKHRIETKSNATEDYYLNIEAVSLGITQNTMYLL